MNNLRKLSFFGLVCGVLFLVACTDDPTCSDGIQNQLEMGIDCGGPCDIPCVMGVPVLPTGTAGTGSGTGTGTGSESDSDSGMGSDSDSGMGTDSATGGSVPSGTFVATVNGTETEFEASVNMLIGFSIIAFNSQYGLTFLLPAGLETGTYELGASALATHSLTLSDTSNPTMPAICSSGGGNIEITEVTETTVVGNFDFSCAAGLTAEITEGAFSLEF